MPELPEVETTARGIRPHLEQQTISTVTVRNPQLRWPIPADLAQQLNGQVVVSVGRRGKYLLLAFEHGTQLIHLGMSGSLRVLPASTTPGKHDHVDWQLSNGQTLRLNDPRRFGAVLWTEQPVHQHPLIASLGPEPLSADFDNSHLWQLSRGRSQAVKSFIMNSKTVVGVGNIYASEALFTAGIHPKRPAGKISKQRYQLLTQAIRDTLSKAIEAGGTTLKDFTQADGKPGYFQQDLKMYGRGGQPCPLCQKPIQQAVLAQRMSYWCAHCQR